jgi:tetratricopeptide (TPR) repeat protein
MKRKNWVSAVVLLLCITCILGGCGSIDKKQNITAGMKSIENRDYETAQSDFKKALLAGEDVREIYRGQGIAYLDMAQYEQAEKALEKSLESSSCIVDDMDYDVNYYLAEAYNKGGKPADAEKIYSSILALRPKETDALYLRGEVRLEQGKQDQAKKDFDSLISLEPDQYDRLFSVYELLDKYGQQKTGQVYLKDALERGSADMKDYDKGRINYYLGNYDTARTSLQKAMNEGVDGAAYYLGKSWEALGEYNYAASVYQSYLKEKGASALIDNELAVCEMKLENYADALTAITNGLKLKDTGLTQTLQYNQTLIYEYQGNFSQALQSMTAYLKAYPDDAAAKREYEFLKTRS